VPEAFQTTGERFPDDTFLELVRDSSSVKLLHWFHGKSIIGPEHLLGGRRWLPSLGAGSLRHLPSSPTPYGSTETLYRTIAEFIERSLGVTKTEASLLAFFCFASHFVDCLDTSPCMLLRGSSIVSAISLLRVLACVCRHPVLLQSSNYRALPREVKPTRLICQHDAALNKLLAALVSPGFGVVDHGLRELNGTTIVYVGNIDVRTPFADFALSFPVLPTFRYFSSSKEKTDADTINDLQNKLLMYRLKNHLKVRSCNFQVPEFFGSTKLLARMLGQCIVEDRDLQNQVIELLRSRDEGERIESTTRIEAIVVEALIALCHHRECSVHVGRVAALANGIMARSGESFELSPKEVGAKLRQLGFETTRLDSAGRGIYLLKNECALIHKLGRSFGVPSLRIGLPGCPNCMNERSAHSARDEHH
jgi:hypothetical protein